MNALAATCLGHLARVYGHLDEDRVVATLRRVQSIPYVRGAASTALEDSELFLHPRRARWRARMESLPSLDRGVPLHAEEIVGPRQVVTPGHGVITLERSIQPVADRLPAQPCGKRGRPPTREIKSVHRICQVAICR